MCFLSPDTIYDEVFFEYDIWFTVGCSRVFWPCICRGTVSIFPQSIKCSLEKWWICFAEAQVGTPGKFLESVSKRIFILLVKQRKLFQVSVPPSSSHFPLLPFSQLTFRAYRRQDCLRVSADSSPCFQLWSAWQPMSIVGRSAVISGHPQTKSQG